MPKNKNKRFLGLLLAPALLTVFVLPAAAELNFGPIQAIKHSLRFHGTPTPVFTRTPTMTSTLTVTSTPTGTSTLTSTATITPTPSWTPTMTPSFTRTWTPTWTYTWTPTQTWTPSGTLTPACTYYVDTFAGGGVGDGDQAVSTSIGPSGLAMDAAGNIYFGDTNNDRVRKVDATGIISTIAGTGVQGFMGDGGAAVTSRIYNPSGVVLDAGGNLYFADNNNGRIRKVDTTGVITTVAGGGSNVPGDGGPATLAQLSPTSLAIDGAGNLYFGDGTRVRRVDTSGILTTVAGNGTYGFSGDGGPATLAQVNSPSGITWDSLGNLYMADTQNFRIRKVDLAGNITTVAGNGNYQPLGDGGPATLAYLNQPSGLVFDGGDNLYIGDRGNNRIRKVDTTGMITTVAGGGASIPGDGGAATLAQLQQPSNLILDGAGNLLFSSWNRIRKVDTTGNITTVAGNGTTFYVGDSRPATTVQLGPNGVAMDNSGNVYFSDGINDRIRKVDPSGIITTVAGGGTSGRGDGGPATMSQLGNPAGIALDGAGNLFIADYADGRVRKVDVTGTITTVAGGGVSYAWNGVPATLVVMGGPTGVAVDNSGNLYISDKNYSRIWKVDPSGILTTAVGYGGPGYSGDGGPATMAQLYYPLGVAVDGVGNLFIADSFNGRIRKVDTTGIITTWAGGGTNYLGNGVPATSAQLSPRGVVLDGWGNLYYTDFSNSLIRRVDPIGTITTIAGNGSYGFSGDGGPATSAQFEFSGFISGLTVNNAGDVYVVDSGNDRVRKLYCH
ncbi:MAG TPA: hypothetical protein VHE12_05315 [bacterium]|nr:hypothetical protein [bacterium]